MSATYIQFSYGGGGGGGGVNYKSTYYYCVCRSASLKELFFSKIMVKYSEFTHIIFSIILILENWKQLIQNNIKQIEILNILYCSITIKIRRIEA